MNDNVNLAQVIALIKKMSGGSTGGGTSDYLDLSNKPQINGVDLSGNKNLEDFGYPIFFWDGQSSDTNSDNITLWKKIIASAKEKTSLIIASDEAATSTTSNKSLIVISPNDIINLEKYPNIYNKFKTITESTSKSQQFSYHYMSTSWYVATISIAEGELVSIGKISMTATGATPFLSPNIDYDAPYEPQYDGSPATKKYVDNQIGDIATILDSINGEEV